MILAVITKNSNLCYSILGGALHIFLSLSLKQDLFCTFDQRVESQSIARSGLEVMSASSPSHATTSNLIAEVELAEEPE
jgi:hypothetical protein